jgi:PBSX family phage terminase large subunit
MPTATREVVKRYVRYGAASRLFRCTAPEVLLAGPAGTGKSRACLEWLHKQATQYPGMRGLILRKTRVSLTQSALVTFQEKVLHPLDRVRFNVTAQQYEYPNGSVLIVGGLDKPTKVMSTEYSLAYVQEATELTEGDWESLTTRLRYGVTPYQQLVGDCNPDAPTHWLKRRCDRGVTLMLDSRHEDNPSVTADYLAKLDALTGVRYLRLRKGMWAAAEGMIYEAFDRARHVVDPATLIEEGVTQADGRPHPAGTKRCVGAADWGYTNPGVLHVYAVDGDGRMVLLHETYRTGHLIDWWTAKAAELDAFYGVEAWACDPSEPAYIEQFRAAGLAAVAGDNAIAAGIQRVQQRLATAPDGRPRLRFSGGALDQRDPLLDEQKRPCSVLEELPAYVWDTRPNAALKELPVDRDNHAADCARYAVGLVDASQGAMDDAALAGFLLATDWGVASPEDD